VAAPWSVGVGAAGAMANPSRAARPAHSGPIDGQHALAGRGLPVFVDAEGDSWRLEYETTSGIPWGFGHWPLAPAWGYGCQIAYYTRHQASVCAAVPSDVARAVAGRLNSWWWPLLQRIGADVGPLSLPLPEARPDQPLVWLAPGECGSVTTSHHSLLGLGVVFKWLRMGPQWSSQSGRTLRLRRGPETRLDVTLEHFDSAKRVPMMFDLPIVALLSVDTHQQVLHRRRWSLDLATASGQLAYTLIYQSYVEGTSWPNLAGAAAGADSIHRADSVGAGATAFLPWTLLSQEVQGLGILRERGTARAEHVRAGVGARSVWVEHELESLGGGHDAWRIGLHGGGAGEQAHAPKQLEVGIRLQVQKLHKARRTQIFRLLVDGFGAMLRTRGQVAHVEEATDAQGLDVHLTFAVDVAVLWRAHRHAPPRDVQAAAHNLQVDLMELQGLARAMAEVAVAMGPDADPMPELRLQQALRAAGPATCALLGRWLGQKGSRAMALHYEQTARLVAKALSHTAQVPPRGPLPWWCQAKALALRSELILEEERLAQDPLLGLCGRGALSAERRRLGHARRLLAAALPPVTGLQGSDGVV